MSHRYVCSHCLSVMMGMNGSKIIPAGSVIDTKSPHDDIIVLFNKIIREGISTRWVFLDVVVIESTEFISFTCFKI